MGCCCLIANNLKCTLFLGDCLYENIYTPIRHLTTRQSFPLIDRVLGFAADTYVQGHDPEVRSRAEMAVLFEQMRYAGELVDKLNGDKVQALALATQAGRLDEDVEEFIETYSASYTLSQD